MREEALTVDELRACVEGSENEETELADGLAEAKQRVGVNDDWERCTREVLRAAPEPARCREGAPRRAPRAMRAAPPPRIARPRAHAVCRRTRGRASARGARREGAAGAQRAKAAGGR